MSQIFAVRVRLKIEMSQYSTLLLIHGIVIHLYQNPMQQTSYLIIIMVSLVVNPQGTADNVHNIKTPF